MKYLQVKNWESFQHYKKRSPPWIKLHRDLLRDYDFGCLQDASKLHLMLIWLLASQLDNKIPADEQYIKNQIGIKGDINFKELIDKGFLIDASNTLANCKQVAIVETETETETETENKLYAHKIPADWKPNKNSITYIEEHGINLDQADTVVKAFIRYWTEVEKRYKNWDLVFQRNPVVKSELVKLKKGNGDGSHIKTPRNAAERSEQFHETLKRISAGEMGREDIQ